LYRAALFGSARRPPIRDAALLNRPTMLVELFTPVPCPAPGAAPIPFWIPTVITGMTDGSAACSTDATAKMLLPLRSSVDRPSVLCVWLAPLTKHVICLDGANDAPGVAGPA
jgi:hypothetical protein